MMTTLRVHGLDCADEAAELREALQSRPGVRELSFDLLRGLMIVEHDEATKSALSDEFYQPQFGVERNPNLPLIRDLQKAGVEIFVCGQALNYKGFPESAVAKDLPIADAALTVTMNRQQDGYGYLPVP